MRLVFDIEADGLYWDVTEVYCLVAYDIDKDRVYKFTPNNIKEGIKLLSKAETLIGHNIVIYDIPVIEKLYNVKLQAKIIDTLIISRLMYPDIRQHPFGGNGLKNWGEHLGNSKINFEDWSHFSDDMLDYCVQDVMLNYDILKAQTKFIKGHEKIIKFETMVAQVCFKQHIKGFGYNLDKGVDLEQILAIERAECLDNLQNIFPDKVEERWSEKTGKQLKSKVTSFNPQSNLQVYERFTEKYPGIEKKIPRTEKGNPQIDSVVLKELSDSGISEAGKILQYRDNLKLEGQIKDWNDKASKSPDGRIHGEVNTQGAGTGRCTHANPNVAQVAKDKRMRALWVPGIKDYVQVGCDLSGLELRMLAHYMHKHDNGAYADIILNGDVHSMNQEAAGLSTRDQAKTFIYGFLYGAGDTKIGTIVGGSRNKGKELKEKFLAQLPALKKVIEEVQWSFLERGEVQLPDGRWVRCRSEHAALNTMLQGAGAIVSKYWMVVADLRLQHLGSKVFQMAYVHDELQFAAHKDVADEVCKILEAASLEAGERLGINMPIHSEACIGSNWQETH